MGGREEDVELCVSQDLIDANPAALLPKPGKEASRDRVITDDEIRRVWAARETERPAMAVLMKLRLVTAQRGGELASLKWSDLDDDRNWLTLRADVTKNKRQHRVYLTETARALTNTLSKIKNNDYLFPGRLGNQPCGDAKKAGQRIAAVVLQELQEADSMITAFDFREHDLRRTASTRMAEAGISQADVAKVLNHVEGGPKATHVYNRYLYDREKKIGLGDVGAGAHRHSDQHVVGERADLYAGSRDQGLEVRAVVVTRRRYSSDHLRRSVAHLDELDRVAGCIGTQRVATGVFAVPSPVKTP